MNETVVSELTGSDFTPTDLIAAIAVGYIAGTVACFVVDRVAKKIRKHKDAKVSQDITMMLGESH